VVNTLPAPMMTVPVFASAPAVVNDWPPLSVNVPLLAEIELIAGKLLPVPLKVTVAPLVVMGDAKLSVEEAPMNQVPPLNVDPETCDIGPFTFSVPPVTLTVPVLFSVVEDGMVAAPVPDLVNVPALVNTLPVGVNVKSRPSASVSDPLFADNPLNAGIFEFGPSNVTVAAFVATGTAKFNVELVSTTHVPDSSVDPET